MGYQENTEYRREAAEESLFPQSRKGFPAKTDENSDHDS